ncbi:MAG: UDP-N-acetylglucosamine 2-epimerase (non-hydrolyzing) [Bacteroidetes bacterium]|jgi:UDP-GlcNAc3NAcA epimerase|nr:UDP-N-acetylglucosamine 2-epimerase (non-hydrolyzing) [Bacteroidota bacterium]MBT6685643.1 UDP-N-acetylglucosamine 2-epimerase (non-hydrolyzing) [Bacteroidota bacterium]MBT7141867.1 UDP-N-acetylglucosamine 2-epimerase (non-hydrolyzing) [Bacteroidota bacterium]MBT7491056.1 UDP-N-acetylglucosamine 2-epimerase (non-hydrolyzing) [Bacteroidota bacterium]
MIKLLTIIGARPQIIKASALSRKIKSNFSDKIEEIILHTGQHYDKNMSSVFFEELQIPEPKYNLSVGSSSHGKQTAEMISGIEEIIFNEKPNFIILYGDTNSTLAGGIAGSKLHIPIVHIEAGLRSFNKSMPEEINRITCDHCSTFLFSPTKAGLKNLIREGFNENNPQPYSIDNPAIFHCGDIMYDNSLFFSEIAKKNSTILKDNQLEPGKFALITIHRDSNTDKKVRLEAIFKAFISILTNENIDFVIPLHPRTQKLLKSNLSNQTYNQVIEHKNIKLIPPVSFLDMIELERNSKIVITDSGGVQKEAFFFQKPCVILRPQTEWVELVENETAIIADADINKIIESYNFLINKSDLNFPPIFGDGNAAGFICKQLIK